MTTFGLRTSWSVSLRWREMAQILSTALMTLLMNKTTPLRSLLSFRSRRTLIKCWHQALLAVPLVLSRQNWCKRILSMQTFIMRIMSCGWNCSGFAQLHTAIRKCWCTTVRLLIEIKQEEQCGKGTVEYIPQGAKTQCSNKCVGVCEICCEGRSQVLPLNTERYYEERKTHENH